MDATMTVALEWRPQRLESARRKIRGAQKHYFSKRYSMSAHMQETEGTAVAMEDSAAAAESDRLGDALVELETDGVAYGDVSLTIAIHGPLDEAEQLDGDIRRIFASHDAKVIREGYGQLPAFFSRMPAQARARQVRSVFMSAGAAACMAPIFGPPRAPRQAATWDNPRWRFLRRNGRRPTTTTFLPATWGTPSSWEPPGRARASRSTSCWFRPSSTIPAFSFWISAGPTAG